jgi:hypothetical protein
MAFNVEWRRNKVKGRRRHANQYLAPEGPLPNRCGNKSSILKLKIPNPFRTGIRPELTLSLFGRRERMRRERIIGWTSAELLSLGLTAVRFSKPRACA